MYKSLSPRVAQEKINVEWSRIYVSLACSSHTSISMHVLFYYYKKTSHDFQPCMTYAIDYFVYLHLSASYYPSVQSTWGRLEIFSLYQLLHSPHGKLWLAISNYSDFCHPFVNNAVHKFTEAGISNHYSKTASISFLIKTKLYSFFVY